MVIGGMIGQHLQLACMKFFAGKGREGKGGGQTCQPESQVSQDMIQNLAGFRSI